MCLSAGCGETKCGKYLKYNHCRYKKNTFFIIKFIYVKKTDLMYFIHTAFKIYIKWTNSAYFTVQI